MASEQNTSQRIQEPFPHLFLDFVGFAISMFLVFAGYSYGKWYLNSNGSNNRYFSETVQFNFSLIPQKKTMEENSASQYLECPENYYPADIDNFVVCISNAFQATAHFPEQRSYISRDATLYLATKPIDLPIHLCHTVQTTVINGYSAKRTNIHQVVDAGCGAVVGFFIEVDVKDARYSLLYMETSGNTLNEEIIDTFENRIRIFSS